MNNKVFYIIGTIVISIGVVLIVILINRDSDKVKVELVKCIDGDTARFMVNGKEEKVRFLAINTPESVHSNGIVEEYGKEASDYTCSMLRGANNIYLEYDVNSEARDKYNRLLGYVYVDDNNLGELLLAKGYAEVRYVYGNYKYIDNFCKVQEEAYNERIGIWNSKKYEDNYCYKLEK